MALYGIKVLNREQRCPNCGFFDLEKVKGRKHVWLCVHCGCIIEATRKQLKGEE